MEGLIRCVSTAISDRFYSFFSLSSAILPDATVDDENDNNNNEPDNHDERRCEEAESDDSVDSETEEEMEGELQARLSGLYGGATAAACSQAHQVLVTHYRGNVGLFLTQFLSPSVCLLEAVRREVTADDRASICKSDASFATPPSSLSSTPLSASPASFSSSSSSSSFTSSSDPFRFWPLAHDDAVVVHLSDVTAALHLRQEGDFAFCVRREPAQFSDGFAELCGKVSLVVKTLSRQRQTVGPSPPDLAELTEFPIPRAQFRTAFTATSLPEVIRQEVKVTPAASDLAPASGSGKMDWVQQAQAAPDHELSYVLRQCLIATEHAVRHLPWEETLLQRSGTLYQPRRPLPRDGTGGTAGEVSERGGGVGVGDGAGWEACRGEGENRGSSHQLHHHPHPRGHSPSCAHVVDGSPRLLNVEDYHRETITTSQNNQAPTEVSCFGSISPSDDLQTVSPEDLSACDHDSVWFTRRSSVTDGCRECGECQCCVNVRLSCGPGSTGSLSPAGARAVQASVTEACDGGVQCRTVSSSSSESAETCMQTCNISSASLFSSASQGRGTRLSMSDSGENDNEGRKASDESRTGDVSSLLQVAAAKDRSPVPSPPQHPLLHHHHLHHHLHHHPYQCCHRSHSLPSPSHSPASARSACTLRSSPSVSSFASSATSSSSSSTCTRRGGALDSAGSDSDSTLVWEEQSAALVGGGNGDHPASGCRNGEPLPSHGCSGCLGDAPQSARCDASRSDVLDKTEGQAVATSSDVDGCGDRSAESDGGGSGGSGARRGLCGGSVDRCAPPDGEGRRTSADRGNCTAGAGAGVGHLPAGDVLQLSGQQNGGSSHDGLKRSPSSGYYTSRHLVAPDAVTQLDYQLLQSGIAILPGSVDVTGRRLMFVFTCSILWHQRQVVSAELTKLLMYYYGIPRKERLVDGVTIVADVRGTTPSTVNVLLEAIYLLQDNVPSCIAVLLMLADRPTQSLVLKSPLYDPNSGLRLEILLSRDLLLQFVRVDQLPPALDGTYPYSHEEWVRFRMKVEPFLANCCAVARSLVALMQEVSSADRLPCSSQACRDLIAAHRSTVRRAFSDPRLLSVRDDGEVLMSSLRRDEHLCCHSEDYRLGLEKVSSLYRQLQETMERLSQAADSRLQCLEQCLQLRDFEEECQKMVTWLQSDGQALLERHSGTADNLKAIRGQQRDFEKLYFSAMKHVEKGQDLMDEAASLAENAAFADPALGHRERARVLRQHLQLFTAQLEDTRERIEDTAHCYSLLDKSYEWALAAMKYVASMRLEHCATAAGLDKLLRSLEQYLRQNPPMSDDTFLQMIDTAQRLHNDKLLEQCRLAKTRCQETCHMLFLRQNCLQRARDQLALEQGRGGLPGEEVGRSEQLDLGGESDDSIFQIVGHKDLIIADDESPNTTASLAVSPLCTQSMPAVSPTPRSTREKTVKAGSAEMAPSPRRDLKYKVLTDEDNLPVWEPQNSSTPDWSQVYANGQRPVQSRASPASSLSSSSYCRGLKEKGVDNNSFSGSVPFVLRDKKCAVNQDSSGAGCSSSFSKTTTTATIPLSPTARLPSRPMPLSGEGMPTKQEEVRTPREKQPLGRTISQPMPARMPFFHLQSAASCTSSSASSSSSTSKAGPLKKMLKRSSTSPLPMVMAAPVIQEDVEAAGQTKVEEKRGDKTLSMITGSSDSLPSMPEEEEEIEEEELHGSILNDSQSSIKWTPDLVNSHLHHSATSPVQTLADLRLSGSKRTVHLIMSEMVQTERDYTRSLQYVIENYIPELQRCDVPQALRGKRNVIFGNVEKIYHFHSQYFLRELEACEHNPYQVGHYFLKHGPEFHLYTLYNKNKPKSDDLMVEFGKHFFRHKQLELGDRMDLASYLLKPVQRMGKYALLLKQILKECPETEPEYPDLKAAEEMVRFQLRHGNDLLAMDSLREVDVNLQEQGRLLRQDEFLVFQGRKKMMRRVFLFEDLILFSKTRRGRQGQHDIYVYKHSLKMADIGLTENCGDSGYKFEIWFRRRSIGDNYILQAPNSEVKRAWVKDITHILWNQAIRNRESHINEMASMGIGNKPCLDIQPSSDNINNRAVNVPLQNRGSRTRNSIAVSSMEYLRNGTKRPHSIISVSSNSSSNSSHSSVGLLGSLNLAFEPADSPRHVNRQSMLSNESGIETDQSTGDGDFSTDRVCGQPRQAAGASPTRAFPAALQPRALNQSFAEPIMTDV